MSNPHDIPGFGDVPEERNFLEEIAGRTSVDSEIVDFTFRIPVAVLEEARRLGIEKGMWTNAAFAVLADICLRARGRPSILALAPRYADYLHRGRRQKA